MSERDGIEAGRQRLSRANDYATLFDYPGGEIGLWRDARLAARALPPAEADEPTAEMVEAGLRALCGWEKSDDPYRACVLAIYLAMRAARPAGGRSEGEL